MLLVVEVGVNQITRSLNTVVLVFTLGGGWRHFTHRQGDSRQRGVGDGGPQSLALALPKIFSLLLQSLSIGNKNDLSRTRLSHKLVSILILSWYTRDTGSYTHTKSLKIFT